MTQKVSSNSIVSLNVSKLTGPHSNATDGSNLTNINDGMIESASDPTTSSNPNSGLGTLWINHTSGEMYCCTDATTNANVWTNVGAGTGDVINQPPTDPNNTGSFQTITENSSYNFTFSGATDDQSGFTYVVDQFSNAVLSVSAAEVAGGSAHTFNTSSVSSDTAVSFRVRTKDSMGLYSSGVVVNTTVTDQIFTITNATGSVSTGTTGNDRYHVFTGDGTLNVTQLGSSPTISFICVAGGGGGGGDQGGGGGAGGMISTTATLPATGAYNIVVGAGAGTSTGGGYQGNNSSIIGPSSFSQVAVAGGGGGSRYGAGVSGGSGGGAGSTGTGQNGGSGTSGQGNNGGNSVTGKERAGGGGGKGAVGISCDGSSDYPPTGGAGQLSNLDGNNYYYAGGGGGGFFHGSVQAGHGGLGGAGGGGKWANYGYLVAPAGAQGRNAGGAGSQHGGHAGANTGSGGGAGGWHYGGSTGGAGGSGIVIIRYTYQ